MSVGLSILSWRGAETLEVSLKSYESVKLFNEFSESQIYLPDPDEAVQAVASAFDIQVKTSSQNLGIMENMALSAATMSTDYVLLLENDCPLIEPISEVRRQLEKSLELLKRDDVIMARLRSVREPGQAFKGLAKFRRLHDGSFKSRLTKGFRPDKILRLTGYAFYDGTQSIRDHAKYFQDVGDDFYLVETLVMPWTNQSILIHRETFLNVIIPLARSVKTKRTANNLPNLEIEINKTPHWRNSGWKIACGPGLFTHVRVGDRGYI